MRTFDTATDRRRAALFVLSSGSPTPFAIRTNPLLACPLLRAKLQLEIRDTNEVVLSFSARGKKISEQKVWRSRADVVAANPMTRGEWPWGQAVRPGTDPDCVHQISAEAARTWKDLPPSRVSNWRQSAAQRSSSPWPLCLSSSVSGLLKRIELLPQHAVVSQGAPDAAARMLTKEHISLQQQSEQSM